MKTEHCGSRENKGLRVNDCRSNFFLGGIFLNLQCSPICKSRGGRFLIIWKPDLSTNGPSFSIPVTAFKRPRQDLIVMFSKVLRIPLIVVHSCSQLLLFRLSELFDKVLNLGINDIPQCRSPASRNCLTLIC